MRILISGGGTPAVQGVPPRDSSRTSLDGQQRPVFASVSTRTRKLRAATFGVRIGFHKDTQVQIVENKETEKRRDAQEKAASPEPGDGAEARGRPARG